MGDHESRAQPSGLLPNGLLPYEAASVNRALDAERWSKAEERTAELIACIQPNQPSEESRNSVADYVQRLIMKCFPCQVFTFGSVPLKTYLPDGDIDLTAFSKDENVKDTWAQKVRDILENEEKSENAEFRVKEVQYIQADVKIIKCLVENIVVDISFDQLGGLCTLCFLEEVDHLINQNHLFKRSIILIKAWCYYESRILGAHHGLISTYALETLVLYIFHVFNNSFAGPLEVLYRFLEFFSNFDWDNFCVSLWGPVPISSLPDMRAEPPRRDSGELLLSRLFLNACSSVYAVFPGGQENQGLPFVSKHFNVIDPLRTNNNLGRSVSKGNFYRIRSAFSFGAKRLARLLECPIENVIAEVNQFFMNTWDRHGSGQRPDAPSVDLWPPRPLNPDPVDMSDRFRNQMDIKRRGENVRLQGGYETQAEGAHTCQGISSQSANTASYPPEGMSRTNNTSAISRTQSHKHYDNRSAHAEKSRKSSQPDYTVHERGLQGRYHFARTRSSPELTDTLGEASSRGRHNRVPETGRSQLASARQDQGGRRKNLGSEVSTSHGSRSSTEDPSSVRHSSSHQSLDAGTDSNSVSNSYHDDAGFLGSIGEELASVSETMEMHQEEQDLVNMMASARLPCYDGQVQLPLNLGSSHLPLPLSPTVLASMGYSQRTMAGMVPANLPLMEPPWGSNVQFPHGVVSAPLPHYFPTMGLAPDPEEVVESGDGGSGLKEVNQEDSDVFWHESNCEPGRGCDPDDGSFQMAQSDDHRPSAASNSISSRMGNPDSSFTRGPTKKFAIGNRGILREGPSDAYLCQNSSGNDVHNTDRNVDSRFFPGSPSSSSSSRSKAASSWDGMSSTKTSKLARDKRGRKAAPSVVPSAHLEAKSGCHYEGVSSDHASSQADDDNRDWIPLSVKGTEMVERTMGSTSVAPLHVQSHQLPGYESSEAGGSDSAIPITPMLISPGSGQRVMDNSGVVPFAFYPTGPPVPFLTMLPVYNFPAESGNSDVSTSHCDRDDGLDNSRINQSDQNFDSAESINQTEIFTRSSSIKSAASVEPTDEHKSDILNSDFASHWQNLQYGRFCQNSRYHGPLIYPSPVMVPPVYLQGHFPWDGPGRPVPANVNLVTQFMSYGPRLVPVTPLQPTSNRPTGGYQRYGDDVPRYRSGTGTYLPNPKVSFRDRQSSSTRNHRGSYNYDRHNHGEKEGNWNMNPKPRAFGRGHSRNQAEKSSSRPDRLVATDGRADRPWDSYRHEPFTSYQAQPQNGPFSSANMAYSMYTFPAVNANGVAPNGSNMPPVVMLYSYDNNATYSPPAEQLEFGSLGPVHGSSVNEASQYSDGGPARGVYEQRRSSYQGGSPARSSPDQPSSPQPRRSVTTQRNSQLQDEDFPPLLFSDRRAIEGGNNTKQSFRQGFPFKPPHS